MATENKQGLDPRNADHSKAAVLAVDELVQSYYGSIAYSNQWDQYEKRRRAYYQIPEAKAPAWRNKLYLASYFLAVKSLHAQFINSHAVDPFVWVKPAQRATRIPGGGDAALKAHSDLNYDLEVSKFSEILDRMYSYVELGGVCVGRESFVATDTMDKQSVRKSDEYGFDVGRGTAEELRRVEYTYSDVIHPLNFAHDPSVNSFKDSSWASVRFELPITSLSKLVNAPGCNPENVKKIIDQITKGKTAIESTQTNFYSESAQNFQNVKRLSSVVQEYHGPIITKFNQGDFSWYYLLYDRETLSPLKLSRSKFPIHPYWKMGTHPDPDGPYGVDPCGMVLPINWLENSTINQYLDYMGIVLKMLYEFQPDNIEGGYAQLVNGLQFGLVPLAEEIKPGETFRPIPTNQGSLQPVNDVISLINRYKETQGPSSFSRGKSGQNQAVAGANTATGMSIMDRHEGEMVQSLFNDCDKGIERAAHIKLMYSSEYFTQPRYREIKQKDVSVDAIDYAMHYPYEYQGMGFSFKIQRQVPDVEAEKHMAFFKLLGTLGGAAAATGNQVPYEVLVKTAMKVGRAMGVDDSDELMNEILQKANISTMPPQISSGGIAPVNNQPGPVQNEAVQAMVA